MDNFVDLALPSGTQWAEFNEREYYDFADAREKFGDALPTEEQWKELLTHCSIKDTGRGVYAVGKNGNRIRLPLCGFQYFDGRVYGHNKGNYLSSTADGGEGCFGVIIEDGKASIHNYYNVEKLTVRLVRKAELAKRNDFFVEVGGSHYSANFVMQPIEFIKQCGWDFIQGNIAKYVLRYKYKNGIEDIKKAISYCWADGRDVEYIELHPITISSFCKINGLDDEIRKILMMIDRKEYTRLDTELSKIQESLKKNEK